MKELELVEATWAELGMRIRPLRTIVFVRTDPHEVRTTGGLWLPPKHATFHGDMLSATNVVMGTVLSAGPAASLKPGDRVAFRRLDFAWVKRTADKDYVGWVDETQVFGYWLGDRPSPSTSVNPFAAKEVVDLYADGN